MTISARYGFKEPRTRAIQRPDDPLYKAFHEWAKEIAEYRMSFNGPLSYAPEFEYCAAINALKRYPELRKIGFDQMNVLEAFAEGEDTLRDSRILGFDLGIFAGALLDISESDLIDTEVGFEFLRMRSHKPLIYKGNASRVMAHIIVNYGEIKSVSCHLLINYGKIKSSDTKEVFNFGEISKCDARKIAINGGVVGDFSINVSEPRHESEMGIGINFGEIKMCGAAMRKSVLVNDGIMDTASVNRGGTGIFLNAQEKFEPSNGRIIGERDARNIMGLQEYLLGVRERFGQLKELNAEDYARMWESDLKLVRSPGYLFFDMLSALYRPQNILGGDDSAYKVLEMIGEFDRSRKTSRGSFFRRLFRNKDN